MRVAFAVSLVASLALCSPAFGATTVRMDGLEVHVTDESDEFNQLSVEVSSARSVVTVRDTEAALEAGEGCVAVEPHAVRCQEDIVTVVRVELGDSDDSAEVLPDAGDGPTCGCVALFGGGGRDRLTGGPAHDRLVGGENRDVLAGREGDDVIEGGAGNDDLSGGAPGTDLLDGGPGADQIKDGDAPDTGIGRDTVIGGTDVDEVWSYSSRTEPVTLDLHGRKRNDGQQGERDRLVNVEMVVGGNGDDRLIGDGDSNELRGGLGVDRLEGRGGADMLYDRDANRSKLFGGQGRDSLVVSRFSTGPLRCGRGHDGVFEGLLGEEDPQGGENPRGPWVSATCEAIGGRPAVDPVPDKAVTGRSIVFEIPRGSRHDRDFHLALTSVSEPFTEFGRGDLTPRGATVRLPADIAERARRAGFQFRAEMNDPGHPRRRVIWRFRQKPAR